MASDPASILCFGPFRLDTRSGELTRDGISVPIERQPAMVLAQLALARGELVSRRDLALVLWGADTHVSYDDGLNYCIRRIRAALQDDPRLPVYVATLPKRGYRFLAPVSIAAPGPEISRSPWRPRWMLAAAATLALAVWVESGPNNHHEITVSVLRAAHDLVF